MFYLVIGDIYTMGEGAASLLPTTRPLEFPTYLPKVPRYLAVIQHRQIVEAICRVSDEDGSTWKNLQ